MAQHTDAARTSAMVIAQAHDRCMAGFAVRLTKTSATDDAVYSEAVAGCRALREQRDAAVAREFAPEQAAHLTRFFEAQAKPSFLRLLERIRNDRLQGRNVEAH
ncbi:hypothetical protein [Sphingomonas swuensis]